jgi:hypothetical protein
MKNARIYLLRQMKGCIFKRAFSVLNFVSNVMKIVEIQSGVSLGIARKNR